MLSARASCWGGESVRTIFPCLFAMMIEMRDETASLQVQKYGLKLNNFGKLF